MSQKWFGEPWPSAALPSPVCSDPAARRPTPVGMPCLHCADEISSGDRGVLQQALSLGPTGEPVSMNGPVHIECLMRMVVGGPAHLLGLCSCAEGPGCDPDMGLSPREAARKTWEWIQEKGRSWES